VVRPRKSRAPTPHNVHVTTSKGREYASHQRGRGTPSAGPRTKLPWPPYQPNGDPEPSFWEAYRKLEAAPVVQGPADKTFAALVQAYLASPEFNEKAEATKSEYRRYALQIEAMWGDLRVDRLTAAHVLAWRDATRKTPAATNYRIRVLSLLISWSIPRGYRCDNPCEHVKSLRLGDGWAPWSWEAIEHFRDHAVPPMWWIAAIALYTGQRQSDVFKMTWSTVSGGMIEVVQQKSGRRRLTVWVPIHRELRIILDAMPRTSVMMVTNTRGRHWTKGGFNSSWSDQMDCLDLLGGEMEGLVFHGLRKSAVCFLLEAGCSTAEVSSVTGQSLQMVEHYARLMDRRSLAAAAMLKWENASLLNSEVG